MPPRTPSLRSRISTFQPRRSLNRVYMRNRSAANSAASSPPVPARISTMASRSFRGSGGTSRSPSWAVQPVDLRTQPLHVVPRQLGQFGVLVGEQLARLGQLGVEAGEPVVGLTNGFEPGVLATELLEPGRVPRGLGVGQLVGDLLRPRERLAESGLHAVSSRPSPCRTSGGSARRGRRYPRASACPCSTGGTWRRFPRGSTGLVDRVSNVLPQAH